MYETFSNRQRQRGRTAADVFTYNSLPRGLRVQAARLWSETIRVVVDSDFNLPHAFSSFHKMITTELGVFAFSTRDRMSESDIVDYFVGAGFEEALDVLEMMFVGLYNMACNREGNFSSSVAKHDVGLAISELNRRFLQHGVGYSFVLGDEPQIVRVDNEHLHSEVVLPALMLLHEQGFEGADDEYRAAHKHFQEGDEKDCLVDCLKAFESTMKTICDKRNWSYSKTDTAKTLIDVCLRNNLLPAFMQSHLGTVRSALESAIPTVRNRMGGHGQGHAPVAVAPFWAAYLLHETAVTIVFLVSAFKALP